MRACVVRNQQAEKKIRQQQMTKNSNNDPES